MFAFLVRILGAVGGFLGGILFGTLAMILVIILFGTFGLKNIRAVVLAVAALGAIVGFCVPLAGIKWLLYSLWPIALNV